MLERGVVLCRSDELADGCSRGFLPDAQGNDTVFLVRQGQALFAYRDICPHYGDTALPWKKDVYLDAASEHIVCAAHGALFDINTGECVRGPCRGAFLRQLDVAISATGEIILLS